MLNTVHILGVKITNETEEKVLEYVLERLKKPSKKFFITTPNPEILVYANSHLDYKNKLNQAEVALPDGVGLLLAAEFLGKPLKNRITGTDFVEKLCKALDDPIFNKDKKPVSMGFLGGRSGVAEKAAQCLQKKYPWIDVAFVGEEWQGLAKSRGQRAEGKEQLYALRPTPKAIIDILFVAYGFPKQEKWIFENLEKLPVKAAIGVGGAFDYISGRVPRAPRFFRSIGLEWLFRLLVQPWRIKRQLALLKFLRLVAKERLRKI